MCKKEERGVWRVFQCLFVCCFFLSSTQTGQAFSFKLKPPFKNPGSATAERCWTKGVEAPQSAKEGLGRGAEPPQIDTVPNDFFKQNQNTLIERSCSL